MPRRQRRLAALTILGAFALPQPGALAAEDGNIDDAFSRGRLDLTLTVPALVRISDLADIDLGIFSGVGLSGSDNVCVWSTTRAYALTAEGDGSGGAFTLAGGTNGDDLPYSVQWANVSGAASGSPLTTGDALTGLSATATSPDCNGGVNTNATVIVNVSDTDLAGVTADTYSGTLTLTVEPE
jgi:hypothetical protein